MGRVGRFGKPGKICLLNVMIDIDDITPLTDAKAAPVDAGN